MPLQDWIAKPWPGLIQAVQEGLANHDVVTLQELLPVILHRFRGVGTGSEPIAPFLSALLENVHPGQAINTRQNSPLNHLRCGHLLLEPILPSSPQLHKNWICAECYQLVRILRPMPPPRSHKAARHCEAGFTTRP
ncbi:MAG: hypothetical protein JNK87_18150 [Bryobacterales bacterium]|nr:hypothetical protein [Bryobacterales bacterium]